MRGIPSAEEDFGHRAKADISPRACRRRYTLRGAFAMRITVTAFAICLCGVTLGAQFGDPNHETTTPDVPGLTAETSECPLSTDPTYGLTKDNPIKTGGGDMYMAARQVRFLNALRGPAGEGVHFK